MQTVTNFDQKFKLLIAQYNEMTKGIPEGESWGITKANYKVADLIKLAKKASALVDRYLIDHDEQETRKYLRSFSQDNEIPEAFSNMLVFHRVMKVEKEFDAEIRDFHAEFDKLVFKQIKLSEKASALVNRHLEKHTKSETRKFLNTYDDSEMKRPFRCILSSRHPVWKD